MRKILNKKQALRLLEIQDLKKEISSLEHPNKKPTINELTSAFGELNSEFDFINSIPKIVRSNKQKKRITELANLIEKANLLILQARARLNLKKQGLKVTNSVTGFQIKKFGKAKVSIIN